MRLEIEGVNCTAALDAVKPARVTRNLNRPAEMWFALCGDGFEVPQAGARVRWTKDSGEAIFTGYVEASPERECLGWNERGPVYRYACHAIGDEWLLDREVLPERPMFVTRPAGEIVREMAASLGVQVDLSQVGDGGVVAQFAAGLRRWSECTGQVAQQTRSAYRAHDGAIWLRPVGERVFTLSEADDKFSPERLKLKSPDCITDAVTALGRSETDAYVKDYFLGDGYTMRFNLSEVPFGRNTSTVFEQEYDGALDDKWWKASGTASVNSGRLWMQGAGSVEFAELMELRGALNLQHGEVQFQAASSGTVGALVSESGVMAGFKVAKAGAESRISAVIHGAETGATLTTLAGHRYLLSTRVYASETVRVGERYWSSEGEHGGSERVADARVVLEVHDVDPNNAASLVTPATVLYDGMVSDIPAVVRYVLLDGADLHCSLAYTRVMRLPNVLVRSSLPGQEYRTRLTGAMMDGSECRADDDALQFFSATVPASNEKIVVEYRTGKRSVGRVVDPHLATEGRYGAPSRFLEIMSPGARTSEDCVAAAEALLDDSTKEAWAGEYETWSDFLPEVWPGDGVQLRVPSRACDATAIVREVEVTAADPANDRSWVSLKFANEAAEPIALETQAASASEAEYALRRDPELFVLPSLPRAEVTAITSTSVTIDAGAEPRVGGGFEVRRSDSGWDPQVDRNLVGCFQTRLMTLPRLTRTQTYCVRQYDGEGKYSRCATQLHVDYPL